MLHYGIALLLCDMDPLYGMVDNPIRKRLVYSIDQCYSTSHAYTSYMCDQLLPFFHLVWLFWTICGIHPPFFWMLSRIYQSVLSPATAGFRAGFFYLMPSVDVTIPHSERREYIDHVLVSS